MCLGPCTELAAQGLAQSQSTAGQADGQMDSQTGYCISADHLSRAKAVPGPQALEFCCPLHPSVPEEKLAQCTTPRRCPHTRAIPSLRQSECTARGAFI